MAELLLISWSGVSSRQADSTWDEREDGKTVHLWAYRIGGGGSILGIAMPYSKRCFKLFVLKKLDINHEVHEEHKEK